MLAFCVKSGKNQDAEEFFGLYLAALDEEMVELHTYISAHKVASTSSVQELEEETQSAEGQAEVGEKDCTVRQLFCPCTKLDADDVRIDANR